MVRSLSVLLLIPFFIGAAAPTKEEVAFRKRAAERYLQFAEAARERVLTPASCPFSPASVVLVVGADAKSLAGFVRERIAYEPYAGVVRGAEGTLAAKSGGDWDRAVLLQALLAEAGYKSKLKVAKRSDAEAAAVVDGFLQRPATIASWYAGVNGEAVEPAAPISMIGEFGIAAENRKVYAAREAGRLRRLLNECLDAAAVEAPHLAAALASSSTKIGQPFDAWRARFLAGAAERVEVEVEGVGVLSIAPDATPLAANATTLDAIPADKVARLSIKLSFIPVENDKPAAAPVVLVERELELGNLFRRPIRLEIVPSDDTAAAKATASWTKTDWFKFTSGFQNFQAILRVGEEWEGSKVFDIAGQVHSVSADGRIDGASQISGAAGKTFGGFGGLGGDSEPAKDQKPKSRLDALTMTLTLSLPGEAPRIQQRLIYGGERPDTTPVFTADLLATPGPVSAHASTWMILDAVTRNAPLATRLILTQEPRRFEQTDDAVRLPKMLLDWQAMRLMLAQRAMAADAGLAFAAGPTVVMRATHVTTDKSQQNVAARQSMDVAFERSVLIPRAADKSDAAAKANTSLGVAATVLESALLRTIDPAHGAKGAFSAFEEARAAGAKPSASPSNPPAVVTWSLSRNEAGRALVFPGNDASTAWWSVDPATGLAIGRGDGGEGQSAMEYLQITKKNVDNLKCMVGMSNQVLGGSSDREIGQQFLLCMTGSDNPGSGHGIPGGIEGAIDPDNKLFDIGIGPMADALGGAKDLYDVMNQDDPILFTGR